MFAPCGLIDFGDCTMHTPTLDAKLKTFPQFCEDNAAFTVRKLRWIDFRSRDKTDPDYARFAPAFARIGRSVYVNESRFLEIATGELDTRSNRGV